MQFYRRSIRIHGVVQGVGFRPHVARVAADCRVTGHCGNDENGVFIEAQGATAEQVDRFVEELVAKLPPLARIVRMHSVDLDPVVGETEFRIVASRHSPGARSLIPPDVAMCPDCRAEFNDPENRRYRYPFITCTHCGPRLSIIEELPYDRPNTTMREFPLCEPCHAEYTDPTNRRFHAQPVSCFDCGPSLWIERPTGGIESLPEGFDSSANRARTPQEMATVFDRIHSLLDDGCILAVKGIGGFHLVCDATNNRAIATLRERKRRPHKPFAVMVADVGVATQIVELTRDEQDLLTSPECPIVIAPKKPAAVTDGVAEDVAAEGEHKARGVELSELIAPGLGDIGVMLPYSGLHMLLVDRPLVVTSGNISGEPVCYSNEQARQKLSHMVDAFVMHDRGIVVPVEDSVFVSTMPSRRARGFAPLPVAVPAVPTAPAHELRSPNETNGNVEKPGRPPTVLATGGELKNTFAMAQGDVVHVSSHIGDMGSLASQQAYRRAVDQLTSMRGAEPEAVICDLHPNYATTAFAERFAEERDIPLFQVQHHWAHALSLLAEHQIEGERAIVAALDGTGYGTDGTVWGGEILDVSTTNADWSRLWHVPHFPIVGGDRAVTHPWRLAAGVAHAWELPDVMDLAKEQVAISKSGGDSHDPTAEFNLVHSQLESGFGTVQSSSLGRVFDAAAALIVPELGLSTTYEAQGPMALEHLAREYLSRDNALQLDNRGGLTTASASTIPELFAELFAAEHFRNRPRALTAALLHDGLARIIADQLVEQAGARDIAIVGVTGGCALNRLLVGGIRSRVANAGMRFLEHRTIPANDGGLSLGQAIAGRLLLGDHCSTQRDS